MNRALAVRYDPIPRSGLVAVTTTWPSGNRTVELVKADLARRMSRGDA